MITSIEASRLGGLRLAFGDAERNLTYYRNLVVTTEQELIKAEREFSSYRASLLEKDNESAVCA